MKKLLLLMMLTSGPSAVVNAQQVDTSLFRGMKVRSIGPAGMSGRVTAIDAVNSNPDIIFVGTASGGLWRSTSGGVAWTPIFTDQRAGSIGAVAIDQSNPDVVWVGAGEGNPRNSQSAGNGVYRTLDGGRTWQHLGLDMTRNIHRIIVNPTNPAVVYVGAQGSAWGEHEERGVFKTTDGGQSWTKILYVDEKTGVGDMVMDPSNPNKLLVGMWEFRRWPWFFKSGGPGSGLYRTVDGGSSWTRLSDADGLPKGELGRIGIAFSRSNPDIVYALVESKKNALYRSEDGGFSWTKRADSGIGGRPFYYGEIHVDPLNESRVYNLHTVVDVSEDGGRTFSNLIPYSEVHPDHHAWWIHPSDAGLIMEGNDGGMSISRDRGRTWRFVENLPLAQFYHINVDMDVPYNVYGGMQDNGSWRGPSQVWRSGGIRNAYWEEVAFGDGFDVVPDPSDARHGYAMSQGGGLVRYELETGYQKNIQPVHPDDVPLRFNWNAAIAVDPFNERTIYYGSQFLHRSRDRGDTWEVISPDLTTNDPEKQKQLESGGLTYDVTQAENFTTIVSIAPSPVEASTIWVGTDDGNLQLTRDGGATWTNVIDRVPGVPRGTWIPQIKASKYAEGEAIVVFDDHRRDNWEPYVYRTRDFGRRWERLVDENDVWGFALSVVQDPEVPELLFLGTEFGLYLSIDDGATWSQWKNGYPTASTIDLVIHPRDHDLVIGTFGNAAWILDDIRPLRTLAKEGVALTERRLRVFEPPVAYQAVYKQAAGTRFAAAAEFVGENRQRGAMISYFLNPVDSAGAAIEKDTVTVEFVDAAGAVVRTLKDAGKKGLNRMTWSLDKRGVRRPGSEKPKADTPEPGGSLVLPGTYAIRMTYRDAVSETSVEVRGDPRREIAIDDLRAVEELREAYNRIVEAATVALDGISDAEKSLGLVEAFLKLDTDGEYAAIKTATRDMRDSIKVLRETYSGKDDVQGIRRDPLTVERKLNSAGSRFERMAPDASLRTAIGHARVAVSGFVEKVNTFLEEDWRGYRSAVEAANMKVFSEIESAPIDG